MARRAPKPSEGMMTEALRMVLQIPEELAKMTARAQAQASNEAAWTEAAQRARLLTREKAGSLALISLEPHDLDREGVTLGVDLLGRAGFFDGAAVTHITTLQTPSQDPETSTYQSIRATELHGAALSYTDNPIHVAPPIVFNGGDTLFPSAREDHVLEQLTRRSEAVANGGGMACLAVVATPHLEVFGIKGPTPDAAIFVPTPKGWGQL